MAIDSKQKRMSAIMVNLPFRGLLVDPAEASITQGNRQAVAYLYAGILAAQETAPTHAGLEFTVLLGRFHYTIGTGQFHFTVTEEDV